jgi:hypothetical protein
LFCAFEKEFFMLQRGTLAALFGVMAIARLASAANIVITDVIGQSFAGSLTSGAALTSLGNGQQAGATVYRVDVFANVNGATATNVFGATSFDASVAGGLSFYTGPNTTGGNGITTSARSVWTPNNPTLNMVDASNTSLNTFTLAADLGGSNSDYVAITNAVDPATLGHTFDPTSGDPTTDPRLAMGTTTPLKLGSLWIVPGASPGQLNLTNASVLIADVSSGQLITPATNITVPPLTVGLPEPAPFATIVIGALGLIGAKLRRRVAA